MVLGVELGGVGNASRTEVGVLGAIFSFWPTALSSCGRRANLPPASRHAMIKNNSRLLHKHLSMRRQSSDIHLHPVVENGRLHVSGAAGPHAAAL